MSVVRTSSEMFQGTKTSPRVSALREVPARRRRALLTWHEANPRAANHSLCETDRSRKEERSPTAERGRKVEHSHKAEQSRMAERSRNRRRDTALSLKRP